MKNRRGVKENPSLRALFSLFLRVKSFDVSVGGHPDEKNRRDRPISVRHFMSLKCQRLTVRFHDIS